MSQKETIDYSGVLEELINIDYGKVIGFIKNYISRKFTEANVKRVFVGLSGGLDSSVTLKLLVEALGPEHVYALVMPDPRVNVVEDTEDAVNLAKSLNVEYHVVPIDRVYDAFIGSLTAITNDPIVAGNLRSRIRMAILYYYANTFKGMVAGTSNRSEILIGYFTKYGDGAADFYPICFLYKTQVRRLAKYLNLPERIVVKPSSPGFWRGHLAEDELGLKYEIIDSVLYLHLDKKVDAESIVQKYGIPRSVVEKVLGMVKSSSHKRSLFNECCLEESPLWLRN